jgi:DNA adenine methylase
VFIYKSFLRWAGSKTKLLPELRKYWDVNPGTRYFEPFMGSAALFFTLKPSQAILSDINQDLVLTFSQIRDNVEDVYSIVKDYPISREFYNSLRLIDSSILDPPFRAARFIYLNRNCYNGLYRTNMQGKFNVPFSNNRNGKLPTKEVFLYFSNLLKDVVVINSNFDSALQNIQPNDFIYLDPPYAVENAKIFSQYSKNTFGVGDLKKLSSILENINNNNARFVLSYADSREIDDIKNNWNFKYVNTFRNIAGFTSSRKIEKEVIISNINIG